MYRECDLKVLEAVGRGDEGKEGDERDTCDEESNVDQVWAAPRVLCSMRHQASSYDFDQ